MENDAVLKVIVTSFIGSEELSGYEKHEPTTSL